MMSRHKALPDKKRIDCGCVYTFDILRDCGLNELAHQASQPSVSQQTQTKASWQVHIVLSGRILR